VGLCFCHLRCLRTPALFVGFCKVEKCHVVFKVLRSVTKKSRHTILWDVTPRNLVEIYRYYENTSTLSEQIAYLAQTSTLKIDSVRSFELSRVGTESLVFSWIIAVFLPGIFLPLKIESESFSESLVNVYRTTHPTRLVLLTEHRTRKSHIYDTN
jgi:hypothetical protein